MVQIAERYARAVGSRNLKNDEHHFDPDVLAAVALSTTFGGLLFRVKYHNEAPKYKELQEHWTWIVSCKALRRKWPDHVDIKQIAILSLHRWLNPICPACSGRKQETVFNTPMLSDRACRVCDGTGEVPLRCPEILRQYIEDMVEELKADERKAGARAARKLRRDADDIDLQKTVLSPVAK
jgi:hypothetical protein